jgi:hypothetical protein
MEELCVGDRVVVEVLSPLGYEKISFQCRVIEIQNDQIRLDQPYYFNDGWVSRDQILEIIPKSDKKS